MFLFCLDLIHKSNKKNKMKNLTHHKNLGEISNLIIGEERTTFFSEEKGKEFNLISSVCKDVFCTESEYVAFQEAKAEANKIDTSFDNTASNWLAEKNRENMIKNLKK